MAPRRRRGESDADRLSRQGARIFDCSDRRRPRKAKGAKAVAYPIQRYGFAKPTTPMVLVALLKPSALLIWPEDVGQSHRVIKTFLKMGLMVTIESRNVIRTLRRWQLRRWAYLQAAQGKRAEEAGRLAAPRRCRAPPVVTIMGHVDYW